MTSSPPDISSLSLSNQQQRLHDSYEFEGSGGNRPQYHFATSPSLPIQSQYNPLTTGQSPLKKPVRGGLPSQWLDNTSDSRSLSPQNNSDYSSAGGSPPMSHLSPPPIAPTTPSQNPDDEIIPTAIVIKNILFNVKRETLLDIIASLSIPTPYAFNYHLDQQGAFRGLAFANFRQAADADAVVAALNGFDVQGRKLRVEYKKVLQASEKERIEREKALRRISYQQQQSQYSPPHISNMPSPFSLASVPAAPQSFPPAPSSDKGSSNELDLNDPSTLEIYSRILLFKDDRMRDELAFSRMLSPKQCRVVHLIAQKLGVYHYSVGEGDERYAVVTRIDPQRQQAQRVPTLSRAPSAYLTPTGSTISAAPGSLRMKKSMPDLKTLHSQAPRLTTRASNGNIREGYATIASPSRRASGFGSLFANGGAFGNSGVPPVPNLPTGLQSAGSMNPSSGNGHESPGGVVRQPRGPGVGGFARRDSRVGASEGQPRGVLDARTYEPLEI
ncbi:RRM/R3H domain-containing protein [Lentinula raphanica]|nr:RRM/R3H domain-containing protein [Lentinula raphanica]